MSVNIKTTKSMEKEHLNGLMDESILENGIKANSMVKEHI